MDFRLSVQLRPSGVKVAHLVEEVRGDLFLVSEFLQDSVEFGGDGLCGVV